MVFYCEISYFYLFFQVRVERSFSGIKFILSDLRTSLSANLLDAIMIVSSNHRPNKKWTAHWERKPVWSLSKKDRLQLTPNMEEKVAITNFSKGINRDNIGIIIHNNDKFWILDFFIIFKYLYEIGIMIFVFSYPLFPQLLSLHFKFYNSKL